MDDERARDIEDLYQRRYAVFRRTLACITGDVETAKDAVQEGFARALVQRDRYRGDGSLEGWVWRICLNYTRDVARRGGDLPLEAAAGTALPAIDHDPALAEAIRDLPQRRRLVVFLRYFAGLSYAEIAEATGTRPGTVAASLAKAHASLQKRLLAEEAVR